MLRFVPLRVASHSCTKWCTVNSVYIFGRLPRGLPACQRHVSRDRRVACHDGRVGKSVRAPRSTPTRPATDAAVGLAPDTSAEAISERAGLLDPTHEQAEAFWREHEPLMLPPDDEP
jgi:hypothetical protein